jgi:acetyl esterase/lipase
MGATALLPGSNHLHGLEEGIMMRKTARLFAYVSTILSALALIPPLRGWLGVLLYLPRVLPEGAPLPLGILGALGAIAGSVKKDRRAVVAGLIGTGLAARHIARVAAPHDRFDQAFGPAWRQRISPAVQSRMLPRRYLPVMPPSPSVLLERDVPFGVHVPTGAQLLADLWQPPADVPRTGLGVIYLHGSGWHYMDKDMLTRPFFSHLANQGHVLMDVAYTLAPATDLYGMVADVKRAIAWLKTNGDVYGVAPERIVLMGGSAGGHLALLNAYAPKHPALHPPDVNVDTSVCAVVAYYAPIDLLASYHFFSACYEDLFVRRTWPERWIMQAAEAVLHRARFLPPGRHIVSIPGMLTDLLGGTPDQVPELYHLASPINHVGRHCPPTLLLQGGHDPGGMRVDALRLHDSLQAAGVKSIYLEYPHTGHGFDLILPRLSPSAQAATYDVERFLALVNQ